MQKPLSYRGRNLSAAGFVHGFFTRHGGTSLGPFASLNCSFSVGDRAEHVAANLARVSGQLGLAPNALVTVCQVHGAVVEQFDSAVATEDFGRREADAITSGACDVGLAVRTADCVPILIGCRKSGRAAAIHAGWKGIVAQVIGQSVRALLGPTGDPRTLLACIGPHIGQDAFEVSPETARCLEESAPVGRGAICSRKDRPHVNLGLLAASQLAAAGLAAEAIEDLGLCTYADETTFFSYRRDGSTSGRQLSVIRPRGSDG